MLILTALTMSALTKDWRLKFVIVAYLAIWTGAQFDTPDRILQWLDPLYTFGIVLLVLCIQSRGQIERLRGTPLAMWLLVPLACELLIAIILPLSSYFGNLAVYRMITFLFYVELLWLNITAARRLGFLPTRTA